MSPSEFLKNAQDAGFSTITRIPEGVSTRKLISGMLNRGIVMLGIDGKPYLATSNILLLQKIERLRAQANKNKTVKILHTPKFSRMFQSNAESHINTWDLVKNKKLVVDMMSKITLSPIWIDIANLDERGFEVLSTMATDIVLRGKRH